MQKETIGRPSLDKPWLKYYGRSPETIEYRDESLYIIMLKTTRCNSNSRLAHELFSPSFCNKR